MDLHITHMHPDIIKKFESFGELLPIFFRVASVTMSGSTDEPGEPQFAVSKFLKCERSRVRRADVEPTQWNGETFPLSVRDRRALGIS